MQVAIYIYKDNVRYRLELFQDENISITSSIQNVNDISKVFTDYSQSFTVPATPHNNKIFAHWYENSIDDGFNANKRYDAEIEINHTPFRKGRIELQSANRDNGNITHYSLVFYGSLKSLTDKFGEDKLIDLSDLQNIGFKYNEGNVTNAITDVNILDYGFPLISSKRAWQHGIGTVDDISISAGSISVSELFPAVRVKRIFKAIENKYNISFIGSFLSDKRFTELFLYAKNTDEFKYTASKDIEFGSYFGDDISLRFDINSPENKFTYLGMQLGDTENSCKINITANPAVSYQIKVKKDGVIKSVIDGSGDGVYDIFTHYIYNDSQFNGVYTFTIETTGGSITTADIDFKVINNLFSPGYTLEGNLYLNVRDEQDFPFHLFMPDMKITDFFSGILKMFNLTAYSENENVYNIESLEDWYNAGEIRDITKYVNLDGEITRAPFYKVINFQYEKSENLISRAFFDNFQREYGDLKYTFDNESDGNEYTIKLPFENLMHQKFSGTKLHVGFCLKSDLKPYVPKPILLYKYGNINTDVNFYLEGSARTSYNAFGQDIEKVTNDFHTLNWGLENSTLLNGVVENTLFSDYYLRYLSNIYNRKSRIIKIEGVADTYLMSVLKLNDRVVIRDKRYVINNIQTELNTGKINLELLTDFRAI